MIRHLPRPIGPLTRRARAALLEGRSTSADIAARPFDRDAQLAWFMLNEASFGGWDDVDDDAEWNPAVVRLRRRFESWFSESIADVAGRQRSTTIDLDASGGPEGLVDRILSAPGPSMSAYLAERGTSGQVAESLLLRFPYQYKEADPHTFAIPRLDGPVKRALCDIQSGEYGVGHRSTHAELFRAALGALDVDTDDVTGIVEQLPGVAFATSNLVSMGGLNRSRRGVVVGQLALFEMDSVAPNGTMVRACERLGLPDTTRRFFDVHVMADAEHEVIAREAFLVDYPSAEPDQLANLLLGIRAQRAIDVALAELAVAAWRAGRSALVPRPVAGVAA